MKIMKKFILSLSLIFVFSAYTLYVRIMGTNAPVALTPEPNKVKTGLSLPQYNNTTRETTTPVKPLSSNPNTPDVTPTPTPVGKYKNGSYIGNVIDASYGNVQVKVMISGGKIADVEFLDYPKSRQTSIQINERAMPYLISEAIALQDSNVDTVSGASFTSGAFRKSLSSALSQARI